MTWFLLIFQFILLGIGYFFVARIFYIFSTFHNTVPYVPTPSGIIKKMVAVSGIADEDKTCPLHLIDLGAGTGKMLFHLARFTPDTVVLHGIEKSLVLYACSRIRWFFSGARERVHLARGSWDTVDLATFDYVFVFLTTKGLLALHPKLEREMKAGAVLVSYLFALPKTEKFKETRYDLSSRDRIFVYTKR